MTVFVLTLAMMASSPSSRYTVHVHDYTGQPAQAEAVRLWQQALPMMTFTYEVHPYQRCPELGKTRGVVICEQEMSGTAKGSGQGHWVRHKHHWELKGRITMKAGWIPDGTTVPCHEMGHVLGLAHQPPHTDSCMCQADGYPVAYPTPLDAANVQLPRKRHR